MKTLFMILGSLCTLYFIGIAAYAGLTSLFPCIWAAGGIFFYGAAFLMHIHEKWGIFSKIWIPVPARYGAGIIAGVLLLLFFIVEGSIISGMLHKPSKNLDYIIVLGAQVNGDKLSNSLKLRLEKAKEYIEENPGTVAILSGGQGKGENLSEAEAMYRYLEKQGIEKERMIMEDTSTNTNENLRNSLAILDKLEDGKGKQASIGVVTNGFHVYRGVSIGKKQGCTGIEGIPAKSNAFLQLNYLVREFFGVLKDKAVGNM